MTDEWNILKKWTIVTILSGAHSFFWGAMAGNMRIENIFAMLAGMATVILGMTFLECHPLAQQQLGKNPLLAQCLRIGLRIRLLVAAYIVVVWPLLILARIFTGPFMFLLMLPTMGELWIGNIACIICAKVTGINLESFARQPRYALPDTTLLEQMLATYLTTLITAAIHIVLLAALCGLIYQHMLWRRRRAA